MAALWLFVPGLDYTLMEHAPVLPSPSHLSLRICHFAYVSILLAENKNVSVWGWDGAESQGELFGIEKHSRCPWTSHA